MVKLYEPKTQKQELQSQNQFNKEMRDLIKPRNNSCIDGDDDIDIICDIDDYDK